jgi:hypothetical protein
LIALLCFIKAICCSWSDFEILELGNWEIVTRVPFCILQFLQINNTLRAKRRIGFI